MIAEEMARRKKTRNKTKTNLFDNIPTEQPVVNVIKQAMTFHNKLENLSLASFSSQV
jgi:hypothetical protein